MAILRKKYNYPLVSAMENYGKCEEKFEEIFGKWRFWPTALEEGDNCTSSFGEFDLECCNPAQWTNDWREENNLRAKTNILKLCNFHLITLFSFSHVLRLVEEKKAFKPSYEFICILSAKKQWN